MNRNPDIDQLLRSWLDEGETTPPERYVWAALERIETTRQRGALVVSLEEFIMRAQPLAAAAAVAIVAILGMAVYIALAGLPNVGDAAATPTPAEGAFQTERFETSLSAVAPAGWAVIEERRSIAITVPAGDGTGGERITVIDTDQAMFVTGPGGAADPWPDDLAAFLGDFPLEDTAGQSFTIDLVLDDARETVIGGEAALIVDVTTTLELPEEAGRSTTILYAENVNESLGTDVLVFAGEGRARFIEFPDRNVALIYMAVADRFSVTRFQAFLDTFRFTDE
jgi:hypothetical protein